MAWEVSVDRGSCLGSGICAALAPELFELADERSRARQERIPPDGAALDAADSCPAAAITVREEGRVIGPRR
ncbi:ferredoxin [Streptomyces gamaensis]|uniref:Ferredoxin n=1 Tax=Streptomyces gamaensis TaxID=1763542 RepID=A0ABW0ZAZ5_9ACTN